jgi:predicted HAD superfamily Cof-like phosphohydrolase
MKRIALQSTGDASLHNQVEQFHKAFDIANRETPGVPPDDVVRYRLRLIAEEAFELIEACAGGRFGKEFAVSLREQTTSCINGMTIGVNLPDFADACGDLDYVVEGARQAFGIDGTPIADAIHTTNMAKLHDGKVVKNDYGKVIKPEGWTPPDIAAELHEQGWDGK